MSDYTQKTADELADAALLEEKLSGDEKIADRIGEVLGASSQTLEEAYLTSIRVRRAEKRARKMLSDAAAKREAAAAEAASDADNTQAPTEIS